MPVLAWIPVQPRVADLIRSQQKSNMIPFGECHQCCQYEAISNRLRNELARIIHCTYQVEDENHKDPIMPLSSEKNYDFYWSNFSAATTVPLKLAILGLQVMEKEQAKKEKKKFLTKDGLKKTIITSKSVMIMQEMEHNRWMAERLLRGWKYEALPDGYAPYPKEGESDEEKKAREATWKIHKTAMTERRTRHQLVSFDKLHEQEIGKDDLQVTTILNYCSGRYDEKFSAKELCIVKLE